MRSFVVIGSQLGGRAGKLIDVYTVGMNTRLNVDVIKETQLFHPTAAQYTMCLFSFFNSMLMNHIGCCYCTACHVLIAHCPPPPFVLCNFIQQGLNS